MTPVYSLHNVQKSYTGRLVLDLDQLEIQRGEILVIVGPSGAGKSTLLRLLNFLEYPDQGEVLFNNQAAAPGMPVVLRRQVTTVFQRPALLHTSVENNISYGLRLRGKDHSREKTHHALQRMGLEHLRRADARTLSGGEAQRVALARALVLEPEVLLLDEPTANLDPYNISLIEDVVRRTNAEQHTSVVLVTHNIFQARRLANRVGLLLNGKLVEISDAHTFFDHPQDTRTRAFINGEMIY